jgi:hypothetical protein
MMFDRRIPFRAKEADDDPVAERYKFDSDDERVEDDPVDHQVALMTERVFLYSRAREHDGATAQAAARRALPDPAAQQHLAATASASTGGGQKPPNHH